MMTFISAKRIAALFCAAVMFVIAFSPIAHANKTVTVVCPNGAGKTFKSITAALAANPQSVGFLTINASGTCTENIFVSALSGVSIVGKPKVTIKPSDAKNSTITFIGLLYLDNVALTTGPVGIYAIPGAVVLDVESSTIKGNGIGIDQTYGGTLVVGNSTIDVTGNLGIYFSGGTLQISASGAHTTSVTSKVDGIYAFQSLVTFSSDPFSKVLISNNPGAGIACNACAITNSSQGQVIISGNGISGNQWAMALLGGYAALPNVTVSDNKGLGGILAGQGESVQLGGTSVTGNSGTGIEAQDGGTVHYVTYQGNGVTTVKGNATEIGCYQEGHQYADIAKTIAPVPKGVPASCLQIGG